jgi:carboxyl-terminal processing protease
VRTSYVDDVDETKLIHGAIRGLVRTLDPYSAFMTPEEFRVLQADTQGRFGGIGCEVDLRDGVLTVMLPLEGTPAAQAGLRPGDRIVEIDGEPTEGMSLQDAIVRMRGEPGSVVRVVMRRPGEEEPRELMITRAIITVEPVEARTLEPGIGYVRLRTFQEDTASRLREELDRLERDQGGAIRGLVLDLRGNPGGLVDQAVEVSDEFLDAGVIVTTRGRGGRLIDEERARSRGTRPGYPIAVLVDAQSASASEIVVGALQDHRRAVIIGNRTYGKGSVQNVIELLDGSALKLTVARYHTPSGRCIQGRGIEPDIVVEPPPGGAHAGRPGEQRDDPPLRRAIEEIRARL